MCLALSFFILLPDEAASGEAVFFDVAGASFSLSAVGDDDDEEEEEDVDADDDDEEAVEEASRERMRFEFLIGSDGCIDV